jgi:excisionase family DNA binding protein
LSILEHTAARYTDGEDDVSEVRVLTTKEVADRLRVKVITVQRWLHAGKLRGTKLPGRGGWRIPASEIERMERGG